MNIPNFYPEIPIAVSDFIVDNATGVIGQVIEITDRYYSVDFIDCKGNIAFDRAQKVTIDELKEYFKKQHLSELLEKRLSC